MFTEINLHEIQIVDWSGRMKPDLATPAQVAEALHTTPARLAQMRYRGQGPKFHSHRTSASPLQVG
jgi:hypothetical protein